MLGEKAKHRLATNVIFSVLQNLIDLETDDQLYNPKNLFDNTIFIKSEWGKRWLH